MKDSTFVAVDPIVSEDGEWYVLLRLIEDAGDGEEVVAVLGADQARKLAEAMTSCAALVDCGGVKH